MQTKHLHTNHFVGIKNSMKIFLTLFTFLFISSNLFAQDYEITGAESWTTNQILNTNVVVKSGGVLTISAAVVVNVHFVDVDQDGIGDISIRVEDGGSINIGAAAVFQGGGVAPAVKNLWWEGIILETDTDDNTTNMVVSNAFQVKNANVALRVNDSNANATIAFGVLTLTDCNNGIVVDAFGSDLTFANVDINTPTLNGNNGIDITTTGNVTFTAGPEITNALADSLNGFGLKIAGDVAATTVAFGGVSAYFEVGGYGVDITADDVTFGGAANFQNVGGYGMKLTVDGMTTVANAPVFLNVTGDGLIVVGDDFTTPSIVMTTIGGNGLKVIGDNADLTTPNLTGVTDTALIIVGDNATVTTPNIDDVTNGDAINITGTGATISTPVIGVTDSIEAGNAIVVTGANAIITDAQVDNTPLGTAVVSSGGNLTLNNLTVSNANKGVVFSDLTGTIINSSFTTIASNAVELTSTAQGVTLDWLTIDGAGTGVFTEGSSVTMTNTEIENNTMSGVFVLDGDLTVTSCLIHDNAFHGLVNAGGVLKVSYSDIIDNTIDGFVAAGNDSTVATSVNVTGNGSYGFEITGGTLATDVAVVPAGATDQPMVKFTKSNINENNGADPTVNVQNHADAVNVANFRENWWGHDGTLYAIDDLVGMVTGGSVDYSSYRLLGAYTDITPDLTPTKTITMTYPYAGQNILTTQPLTITWTTEGNIANVDIAVHANIIAAAPTYTVPNTGSYTITPDALGAGTITITENGGAATTGGIAVTSIASALTLEYPNGGETVLGRETVKIRWIAPASITNVKLEYQRGNGTYATILGASSLDASLGEFNWVVPNVVSNALAAGAANYNVPAAAALVRVSDASAPATNDVSDAAFTIEPRPNVNAGGTWYKKNTSLNMTINFQDLDLLAVDDPDLTMVGEVADANFDQDPGGDNEQIWLGAFYNDAGTVRCCGYVRVTDSWNTDDDGTARDYPGGAGTGNITLIVYGDDPNTTAVDGAPSGAGIIFKVWRHSWTAQDTDGDAITVNDDPNDRTISVYNDHDIGAPPAAQAITFTNNDIIDNTDGVLSAVFERGAIVVAAAVNSQDMLAGARTITAGNWAYVSTFMNPTVKTLGWSGTYNTDEAGAAATSIFTASNGTVNDFLTEAGAPDDLNTDFVMLKDGNGSVYWNVGPTVDFTGGIDQLSNTWDYKKGYMLLVANNDVVEFEIFGTAVTPAAETISLTQGWSLIPFFGNTATDIGTCLSSIADNFRLAKDGSGNVYWPEYTINTIGNMSPSYAYWVNMNSADNLVYPASVMTKSSKPAASVLETEHYVVNRNSDNSSVLGILESAVSGKLQQGDEVGVFNTKGQLVGSTVFEGGNMGMAVWGVSSNDDSFGMQVGENYEVRVYQKASKEEIILDGLQYIEGDALYKNNGMSMIGSVDEFQGSVPTEFGVLQNYPNPFNPSTTIKFALPKASKVNITIFNILGEVVAKLADDVFEAGYHKINFNASKLSSGVYLYRINAGDFMVTKKMNLLK
ncbi:MAG: T9SS type A sorting domain-containing protein [Melioribacteraceae bacterium]|nr:T9SS type A sorting domain-containing protein [Melioribacteraceae bacterium]